MNLSNLFILCNLCSLFIYCAESKYPADISYLVSDFKYSREHGLKICEVQQGVLSAVTGDVYLVGGDGTISPRLVDFLAPLPMKKWGAGLLYPPLKRALIAKNWEIHQSMKLLSKDPTFLEFATKAPPNPFSITFYGGMVYAGFDIARNHDFYRKAYPGILFIDAATFPYWRDKYKMSSLFDRNEELKLYKADWRLYPKNYAPLLSEQIQKEMPSDLYVIKPKSECLAKGVIVVANKDLDSLLQTILNPTPDLKNHPDKKYAFWSKNREETFLIEKYYPSDLMSFNPQGKLPQLYDATLRLAFILQYSEGKMSYHPLGGFWKLPPKSLEEEGTLNETRISLCEPPFYAPIDPDLFIAVNREMEKAMLLLYEIMLNEL